MDEMARAGAVSGAPFWFWWLVPVVVTALVVVGVRLASRRRRPKDGYDAVDDYARFRASMSDVRDPQDHADTSKEQHR